VVNLVSFITGARSLNEEDLRKNLQFFKVPQAVFETIRSKLAMTLYDEYAKVFKGMCSIRLNGGALNQDTSTQAQSSPHNTSHNTSSPLPNTLEAWLPNKVKKPIVDKDRE